ncbi:DUF4405 domain-containing protein [Exilibacterium tricleocarpae]|uniref:DUF4405 domain-containing protein n=1 Tax=Exilibacterium tricleocarpae TaxID=2591008 RepID=A0A545TVB1_9GAMM|nr:DUF4405 domain-containing protein [Exilibacterium tricleocarpae]TQV81159.1 DUF4405 domain-containing protein [Exilibacterium tricleocarpae]
MKSSNRTRLVQMVDVIAFALFTLLTSSGILLHYVLPQRSGRRLEVWGLHRHDWGQLHFWIAVVFFAVLVLHLGLHRHFIVNLIRGGPRQGFSLRLALGVIGLLAILLLGISPFIPLGTPG